MANYKEGLNNILQAINNMISPQLVSLKYDKTFRGKITKIIDAGVYEVQVNGNTYTLPYDGSLNVGDIVKVKSPLNNFSDIYIEAIGGSGGSGTSTSYNDLTNKPNLNTTASSSLSTSSSEIIKGTINLHRISKTGKYDDLVGKPDLDFIPNSEKGAAGGIATLDDNSKLTEDQLPDGIVTDPNYIHTDNNFTDALLTKLNDIEAGAQVNKIETISRNGITLPITDKNVNIEVPTKLSELENDNNTVTDRDYVHTDNNFTNALLAKLNGIEAGAEVNAIAGIKVNDVLQPINNKIVNISVPTKTSDLTNDSGFIDKDVDNLANYYTETEVDNLLNEKANKTDVPTKVSQLENDTGFITNTVNNLTNYYLKSETYTQTEVNNLIGQIKTISIEVVDKLPEIGEDNKIYLVPKEGSTGDIYNEYIWVNNAWELIGSTQIDLTGYATEDWVNVQIKDFVNESQVMQLVNNSLTNYYTQTQVDTLLENKADKSSIPTKTSDLTNDSGYIDNTVNNLINYYNKNETYTQTEVNNLLSNKANTSDIPTKTSQLTNDNGYIDNTVDDLENYYKKSETYNQTEINNLLDDKADKTEIPTKVSQLENDKGYLTEIPIASKTQLGGVKVGNNLEVATDGTLSANVPTKTSELINNGEDGTNPFISEIPIASSTQLGGIKVGDNLSVSSDGTLSATGGGTNDYNNLTNKPVLNTNISTSLPVSEGETITGEMSLHKISKTGNYSDLLGKPNIPVNTSDLNNDSGFITKDVNNLTNYYNKTETYTQTQVNNLLADKADVEDIPITTSQLTNDSGFITNSVDDLTNYYKKSETYNQTQVNNLLGSKANTTDIPTKVSQLENDEGYLKKIPIATADTLGGIKVGDNLSVTSDGTLSAVVVDNLSSTSTTNALSANQGKVLNDTMTSQGNRINTLEDKSAHVLYTNESGSRDTITLSDDVSNYSYIKIYYRNDINVINSQEFINCNNKDISLFMAVNRSDSQNSWLQISRRYVSGNKITVVFSTEIKITISGAVSVGTGNYIFITKVEGFK